MFRAMRLGALIGALVLVGCAGPSSDEAGHDEAAGPGGPVDGWSITVRRTAADARALEFEVAAPSPIPARAADPVLLVGAVEVREYRYEKPNVVVFTAADAAALPDGAELALGWATGRKPPIAATRLGRFDKRGALSTAPR